MQIFYKNVNDLKPYKNNARTHTPEQIAEIAEGIKAFGFLDPIEVDKNNVIISGHARLEAAISIGLEQVPTIAHENLTDAQRKAYTLAANKLATKSGWDSGLLKEEFEALKTDDMDLSLTGFTDDEIEDLLNPEELNPMEDEDAEQQEVAHEVSKLGDIWLLGEHRLMCGDNKIIDYVEKLLGNEKADMIFTDPPYNIAKETRGIASHAPTNKQNKKLMECDWDKNFDFNEVSSNLLLSLKDDCSIYVCASHFTAPIIWQWMAINFDFNSYCVWSKPNPFPSLTKKHWAFSSELICYATKGKNIFNYPKTGNALSVWELAVGEGGLHPTQKPVTVPEHAIYHSSKSNAVIFDPFGGSGTTLIACEKIGRKCLMMEILPKYCDMIIRRWQKVTGKLAILESTGEPFHDL